MIDIHITNSGVELHIENERAIDVMTALTAAVFHVCERLNFPINTTASALIKNNNTYKSKEA